MNWAVLVAGGKGARMGLLENKAFAPLAGVPMLVRSLRALLGSGVVDGVTLVCGAGERQRVEGMLAAHGLSGAACIAEGGADRQASVFHGLQAVPEQAEFVLVHDAARPLVTRAVIRATLEGAKAHGSGVAAVPVKDTIKRVDARGVAKETPARDALRAVQTPQTFAVPLLRAAHARALDSGLRATDDAALVEALGEEVWLVEGDVENIKVTTPEDIAVAEALLARRGEGAAARALPFRVGHGYDVHRLVEERALILCGVRVPFERGLLGHSDADVAAHALSDALLGAAGLGDIGRHFPDTDPAYKGADSMRLLAEVAGKVAALGYAVGNVDVTIAAQRPKLKDFIPPMVENVARTLGIAPEAVNVKATTTEGLGFEGEGLGISAQAVALLVRK